MSIHGCGRCNEIQVIGNDTQRKFLYKIKYQYKNKCLNILFTYFVIHLYYGNMHFFDMQCHAKYSRE